jgi:hypothetical protein
METCSLNDNVCHFAFRILADTAQLQCFVLCILTRRAGESDIWSGG